MIPSWRANSSSSLASEHSSGGGGGSDGRRQRAAQQVGGQAAREAMTDQLPPTEGSSGGGASGHVMDPAAVHRMYVTSHHDYAPGKASACAVCTTFLCLFVGVTLLNVVQTEATAWRAQPYML